MRLRRDAAEDGAVLEDISRIVVKTRGPLHCGFRDTIGMDFSVSDIDQVLQAFGQRGEEQAYRGAIRVNEDAGLMDVGWYVIGLITDFER